MIDGAVHFGTELWGTLVAAWTAFSDFLAGFADMGMTPVAELLSEHCAQTGTCQEATALTMAFAGIYIVASILPSAFFGYLLFKSIFKERKKAAAGVVAYKGFTIGIVGYFLNMKPTPHDTFSTLSYGPVTVVEAVSGLIGSGDWPQIFTVAVTFGAFFALAWLMFYAINLMTYFIGILVRPNPPWSQSSGKGHALLYTIAWMFFMTMSSPAAAFVNVMILNAVVLWRRAEWKDQRRGSDTNDDITADKIADAMAKAQNSDTNEVPSGTERIDYRKRG